MAYHFNTRVAIIGEQQTGPYPDDFEEVEIAKPWADIKTIKGSEYYEANVTANKIPMRFIIRYREGITTKQKVKYKGDLYNIESVQNDNAMNQTLTIFAVSTK
jgi:SPP1 family predicted phage head-tail adaptor